MNGTTGLIGDLQSGVAEIGWANMFATPARLAVMEISEWYSSEPMCFLFKRPRPYDGIYSLVFPLQEETWLFTFASLAVVAAYYILYSLIWRGEGATYDKLLLYLASVTFKESHGETHLPRSYALRF